MAKKVTAQVKLQIPAGKATPAPPVGTALGPQGVNIMEFCKAFNAKTSAQGSGRSDHSGGDHDLLRPQLHVHHQDPARPRAGKARGEFAKGSAEPNKNKVGKITAADRGDREDQDAGSQLLRSGCRHALGQGYLP